jgi:probable HAF family extracellular repeat protein
MHPLTSTPVVVLAILSLTTPGLAQAASFTPLGDLAGGSFQSQAIGVSADGSVVVGFGNSDSGQEAFRWTSGGGMVGLGDLPGGSFGSIAYGVSADGSVVVGFGNSASGQEAFLWTSGGGMERLFDVLVANGATGLTGWTLRQALGVSDDGQWIVGYGTNPLGNTEAFLARLTPVPLPATVWLLGGALGLLGAARRRVAV